MSRPKPNASHFEIVKYIYSSQFREDLDMIKKAIYRFRKPVYKIKEDKQTGLYLIYEVKYLSKQ